MPAEQARVRDAREVLAWTEHADNCAIYSPAAVCACDRPIRAMLAYAEAAHARGYRAAVEDAAGGDEIKRLTNCLAYLASCEAATVEGAPKSMPKSQRRRHCEIAKTAQAFLRGGAPNRPPSVEWTLDRLSRALGASDGGEG